jgi:excisionase family DNA binding protein
MKSILTTGDVAVYCAVSPRTVTKWFDSGRLRGYRIPGSQDRRIPRGNLLEFCRKHGIPTDRIEADGQYRILVVGADAVLLAGLKGVLQQSADVQFHAAASGFEAGVRANAVRPDCVVVDAAIGRIEASVIAQALRADRDREQLALIALVGDSDTGPAGFDDAFRLPYDGTKFASHVLGLIGVRRDFRRKGA